MLRTSSLRTLSQTLELGTFQSDNFTPFCSHAGAQCSGEVSFDNADYENSRKTSTQKFLSLKPNGNRARAFLLLPGDLRLTARVPASLASVSLPVK